MQKNPHARQPLLILGLLCACSLLLATGCGAGPVTTPTYPNPDSVQVHPDAKNYDSDNLDVKFFVSETGTYATMAGTINTSTPDVFDTLRKDHPNVVLLVMYKVPGSADDDANLKVARMVRDAKMATFVPADGLVASGGTDFFIAGVKRAVGDGGKVGVHSWAGGGKAATDYPDDSSEHEKYIKFYQEMGMTQQQAEDFYFFTIKAAPPEGMHYMSAAELQKYNLLKDN